MEFSAVQLLVTAVTGGLLGGFVQQFIQLRMAKVQRRTEDQRRAEDRAHVLEDRRRAQREDRYIELLGSVARYETALSELEGLLVSWLDFVAVIENNTDPEIQEGARTGWRSLPVWGDRIFDHYDDARDDLVDKINAAVPVASSDARLLFGQLETHPPTGLLRVRVGDESLTDGTAPSTVPRVVAQLADGPGAVRLIDRLRDVCTELDLRLRRELELD